MNILTNETLAQSLHFDSDNLWVEFTDGRKLSVPLAYFPRLLRATKKQRLNYVISGGGIGLHWEELDEDISVKNLLLGIGDQTSSHEKANHKEYA